MAEEALALGVMLMIVGFALNVASPHVSPFLEANVGIWGGLFALIGLIIIAIRLRAMMR